MEGEAISFHGKSSMFPHFPHLCVQAWFVTADNCISCCETESLDVWCGTGQHQSIKRWETLHMSSSDRGPSWALMVELKDALIERVQPHLAELLSSLSESQRKKLPWFPSTAPTIPCLLFDSSNGSDESLLGVNGETQETLSCCYITGHVQG